jgi:hypothetical protein
MAGQKELKNDIHNFYYKHGDQDKEDGRGK